MTTVQVKLGQSVVFTNKLPGSAGKNAAFIARAYQDSSGHPVANIAVLNPETGLAEGYSGVPLINGALTAQANSSYIGYVNLAEALTDLPVEVQVAFVPPAAAEVSADVTGDPTPEATDTPAS